MRAAVLMPSRLARHRRALISIVSPEFSVPGILGILGETRVPETPFHCKTLVDPSANIAREIRFSLGGGKSYSNTGSR